MSRGPGPPIRLSFWRRRGEREALPPVPGATGVSPPDRQAEGRFYIDLSVDTQFNSAWIFLALAVSLAGFLLNSAVLLSAAMMLLVVSLTGWLWNRLSLSGLHYTRHLSERRAFLGETIELTLTVRNQKWLPLTWLDIVDTFPAGLPVDGQPLIPNPVTNLGQFRTFWTIGGYQRLERVFRVECTERGYHAFGPVQISTGDGFGLFDRRAGREDKQYLIVYPRLYPVSELRLPAKNPFGERRAQGLFEDPLRTAGIRRWQAEDSRRRIHWKATARHAEMLSRLYEPSEEPQVLIFLNVATLPRHWQGTIPELQERAISVAASLAAACSEMRLPVGLVANGFLPNSDQALRLGPGRSPDQVVRILELLAGVTPYASQPIEEMLLQEATHLPWGATILVVTAVAHDSLLVSLEELRRAGRQVVLFTLAEEPPARHLSGILVYHLPHLVADLVTAQEVAA